jgi:hypothetical protein
MFEDEFGRCPSLIMQNWTRNDIALYVKEQLDHASPAISELFLDELVSAIVERAAGSFLWVVLVVRSIREGLANGDRMSNLQRRLNEVPHDLEYCFQQILDRIEPRYRQELFFNLDLMAACSEYPYGLHSPKWSESTVLTVLDVYYITVSGATEPRAQLFPEEPSRIKSKQINQMTEEVQRRLQSRTNGLLEISSPAIMSQAENAQICYMHRTVADFFHRPNTQRQQPSNRDHTVRMLLQATVMRIKRFNAEYESTTLNSLFGRAMVLAKFLQISHSKDISDVRMLNEIGNAISHFAEEGRVSTNFWSSYIEDVSIALELGEFKLLYFATLYGLVYYVETMLTDLQSQTIKARLLRYACIPKHEPPFFGENVSIDMAAMLIREGADPNRFVDESSTWQMLIPLQDSLGSGLWLELLSLLLVQGGADSSALATIIDDTGRSHQLPAYDVLESAVFETDELQQKAYGLQKLLKEGHNIPRRNVPRDGEPSSASAKKTLSSRVANYFDAVARRRQGTQELTVEPSTLPRQRRLESPFSRPILKDDIPIPNSPLISSPPSIAPPDRRDDFWASPRTATASASAQSTEARDDEGESGDELTSNAKSFVYSPAGRRRGGSQFETIPDKPAGEPEQKVNPIPQTEGEGQSRIRRSRSRPNSLADLDEILGPAQRPSSITMGSSSGDSEENSADAPPAVLRKDLAPQRPSFRDSVRNFFGGRRRAERPD